MAYQTIDLSSLREEILEQSRSVDHEDDEGLLPDVLDHVDKARDLAMRLLGKMQEFDPGASSLLYATQVPTKGFKGGPEATSAEPSYRGSVSPEIPQIDLLKLVDQLQRENTELRSKNKATNKDQSTQTEGTAAHDEGGHNVLTQTVTLTSGNKGATGIPTLVKSSPHASPLLARRGNSGQQSALPRPTRAEAGSKEVIAPTRERSGKKKLSPRPPRKAEPAPSKSGWYRVDAGKKLYMRVVGGNVVVRVGGGWMALREYLSAHTDLTGLTPQQAERKVDSQVAVFTGKCSAEAMREDSSGAPHMAVLPSNYYGNTQRLHTEDEVEEAFTRVSRASLASHIADVSSVHLRRQSQMRSSQSDSSAIAGLDLATASTSRSSVMWRASSPLSIVDGVLGSRDRRASCGPVQMSNHRAAFPPVSEEDSFY